MSFVESETPFVSICVKTLCRVMVSTGLAEVSKEELCAGEEFVKRVVETAKLANLVIAGS